MARRTAEALHADLTLANGRRALASVDNLSIHMEDDDMGLQNQPSLVKDSQEMEQILVDLGGSDLAQADLFQAIKTLESGGDGLSTGETDAIFPGFDLTEAGDSEGDAAEDKIRLLQARLERRCAFLQRRLRILQARAIGKRISEEAAQTFEKVAKAARKDGCGRPIGLKAVLKKVETTAALQASVASRSVVGPTYYNPGTSKGDVSRSASIGIPSGTLAGLEDTAGALRSHLSAVKHELDSDATLSSSGAESNDEAVSYNNPQQQPMAIEKRALWSWQRARASIASRWTWLQAQVQELEYKIRQHNELHRQVREAKGTVQFENEPSAYLGSLPGSELPDDVPDLATCARVRPLRRDTFKKRKLLQMHNLHIATSKAAKPSDIKCFCIYPAESCPICTGRAEPQEPVPPFSTLSPGQKVAFVDPCYHPVLSDVKDISVDVHMSVLAPRPWFRSRLNKAARSQNATLRDTNKASQQPKPIKLKRGRPPSSKKTKEREKDDESSTAATVSEAPRSRGRPSTDSKSHRRQSYDIDNIVIPQSIAANTRPQILTYKEIVTPKWRMLEIPEVPMNNGISKTESNRMSFESEEEDISDAAVCMRHNRAEIRERNRFMSKPRSRRAQQPDAEPIDVLRHQAVVQQPPLQEQPVPHETVRPYTPRKFPLQEDAYMSMISDMPYTEKSSSPDRFTTPPLILDEETSTASSPMSPTIFDGDDPDDAEWNPNKEKVERRKSAFR